MAPKTTILSNIRHLSLYSPAAVILGLLGMYASNSFAQPVIENGILVARGPQGMPAILPIDYRKDSYLNLKMASSFVERKFKKISDKACIWVEGNTYELDYRGHRYFYMDVQNVRLLKASSCKPAKVPSRKP